MSGWQDSNLRPPRPKRGAITGLRYTPKMAANIKLFTLTSNTNFCINFDSMSTEIIKTLIIGSGPAGYTAAIYASRADLKPVLYTGMEPGGQLTTTTEVDNFPGYPKGVDGPKMMEELKEQAERFGTDVRIGEATSVIFSEDPNKNHEIVIDHEKKFLQKPLLYPLVPVQNIWVLKVNKNLLVVEFLPVLFVMGFFTKVKKLQLLVVEIQLLKRQHT